MEKFKIVVIGVTFDYYRVLYNEIREENDSFSFCDDITDNIGAVNRILYKLHTSSKTNKFIKIPFKKIWCRFVLNKDIKKKLKSDDHICFVYSGGDRYLDLGVVDYLRKKYVNSKFLYLYNDLVSLNERLYPGFFNRVKTEFDFIATYNMIDSQNYSLFLLPPFIPTYKKYKEDSKIENDVFFVGANKNRIEELLGIYEIINKNGYKCDFNIINVPIEAQRYSDSISYNHRMNYYDVLKHVAKSKAILNICQAGASGITMRDYEAIGMGKILITNNREITNYCFYDPNLVVFVEDLEKDLNKILDNSYPCQWPNKEKYNSTNYLNAIYSIVFGDSFK